jgi:hypothetical protein
MQELVDAQVDQVAVTLVIQVAVLVQVQVHKATQVVQVLEAVAQAVAAVGVLLVRLVHHLLVVRAEMETLVHIQETQ